MSWPFRVTDPLLEVVEVLLNADSELHGWAIMKATHRSGPTVYQVLERLRKADWVVARWEDPGTREARDLSRTSAARPAGSSESLDHENTPRRRYYSLSGEGMYWVPVLLDERARRRAPIRLGTEIPGMAATGRRFRAIPGSAS